MISRTITIVKSKAPWYGFDLLLIKKFREANAIYEKVNGLEFKAYSTNHGKEGKNFGGIYLWSDKSHAERWYTPQWFADIKRKRGVSPQLEYYEVIGDPSYISCEADYSKVNTCRCNKKAKIFISQGVIDPKKMVFNTEFQQKIKEIVSVQKDDLNDQIQLKMRELFQDSPFQIKEELDLLINDIVK